MSGHPGSDVLDLVESYLGRFVSYPCSEAHNANVLWIVHTHLLDAFDTTPRLLFTSPGPGMGKSRALQMTAALSRDGQHISDGSTAWLVRSNPGTVCLDEVDTRFSLGKTPGSEQFRGHLNAGHSRGTLVGRIDKSAGGGMHSVTFEPFGAIALGGLGSFPATVVDRSIHIRMRPPLPGERVEPWRRRDNGEEADAIRADLAAWADSVGHEVARSRPVLPPRIVDRRADVWEPLIAVADAAGGRWPTAARAAAVWFIDQAEDRPMGWGATLLSDIRKVFTDRPEITSLWTGDLLAALSNIPESPWAEQNLTPRRLAQQLSEYGIRSKDIRIGDRVLKGYERPAFLDAWARYCTTPEATGGPEHLGERSARRGTERGRSPGRGPINAQEAAA